MEEATRLYMDKKSYSVTQCLNATNTPCSIPQMKDVIDIDVVKGLKACPTIGDFKCEKMVLAQALGMGYLKCTKPCQKWRYQMTVIEHGISEFWKKETIIDTLVALSFSTSTFTQMEEIQVVTITQKYASF